MEAAVDALIPADETGPGGSKQGSRPISPADGRRLRARLSHVPRWPLGEGTPQQGWQIAMTPAELIRAGIADVDAYALRRHKKRFAFLPAAERGAVLAEVEAGKADLATAPPRFSSTNSSSWRTRAISAIRSTAAIGTRPCGP